MALSDEQIKIVIAAELKKQGFDKAQKATNSLEQSFKRLGGTLAAAFSVAAITRFAKVSIQAFKEDEAAAVKLGNALKGLNLGFATPEVENYISGLQTATGVSDDQLRPAFQRLAQVTRDITYSQELLATALDVSAGSGVDLQTVVSDLSRAYVGQTRGLTKYNLGLTQAELKTAKFADLQEKLNQQFGGARAALLTTYAGKVDLLKVSYEEMQETIGRGLVDAFTLLAGENGIQGATNAMEKFGVTVADVIRGVAVATSQAQQNIPFFDKIFDVGNIPVLGAYIEFFRELGKQNRPLMFPTAGIGQPGVDRQMEAFEKARLQREKEMEALRLRQLKQQEKLNRLKKIRSLLDKAEQKFDERRIQIAAALQGNISDEERKRLLELQTIEDLKQAIADQDLETAETLLQRLNKLQDETELLATTLIDLKAGDPFKDWDEAFAKIFKSIDGISKTNPFGNWNSTLQSVAITLNGLLQSVTGIQNNINALLAEAQNKSKQAFQNVISSQASKVDAYQTARVATEVSAVLATQQAANAISEASQAVATAQTPEELAAANAFLEAAYAAADAAETLADSVIATEEALALASYELARSLEEEATMAMLDSGISAQTVINVTVEGSVISEQDLADSLTNLQYDFQKAGRGLLYSSVAI